MTSKKLSNEDLAVQFKNDMVNYIGPIFQELKSDIKRVETILKGDIKRVETILKGDIKRVETDLKSLKGDTHRLGILMEDMKKEVNVALEASSSVLHHEGNVKDHEDRIELLERDVKVLKTVRSPKT